MKGPPMPKPIQTAYARTTAYDFPGAITLRILLTSEQTGGTHVVFEDIVQPNIGPPRHIHHDQDETFFFLEGEFDVEVDGQLYHMAPGDVAFIPRGATHAFKNVGETPGRLRYIFSPALEIENMFLAFHAAQSNGDLNTDKMAEISARYGQSFVGPPL